MYSLVWASNGIAALGHLHSKWQLLLLGVRVPILAPRPVSCTGELGPSYGDSESSSQQGRCSLINRQHQKEEGTSDPALGNTQNQYLAQALETLFCMSAPIMSSTASSQARNAPLPCSRPVLLFGILAWLQQEERKHPAPAWLVDPSCNSTNME